MAKRILQTTRKYEPMKVWITVAFFVAVAYLMGAASGPTAWHPSITSQCQGR